MPGELESNAVCSRPWLCSDDSIVSRAEIFLPARYSIVRFMVGPHQRDNPAPGLRTVYMRWQQINIERTFCVSTVCSVVVSHKAQYYTFFNFGTLQISAENESFRRQELSGERLLPSETIILALGLQESRVMSAVQPIAWNVTSKVAKCNDLYRGHNSGAIRDISKLYRFLLQAIHKT